MNKKHSVSSNMLSRSLICIRVLQFLWINERTFLFHEFLNKYMKHDADRRPCLLPGSGQCKCWSFVSISNRLCSSELSSVLIFLWAECLHEVRMNVESYPNADMAHCLTSVGHCGYFCRASMIWLWSSISLISWYSLWVLAAVLSTGRISSSCCRCSKAWGRERSRNWLFIQKDKVFS